MQTRKPAPLPPCPPLPPKLLPSWCIHQWNLASASEHVDNALWPPEVVRAPCTRSRGWSRPQPTLGSVWWPRCWSEQTCQVFCTGSEWRTGAAERLCYQAPASIVACSGAQLPQSRLTDTPGAPAQPTLCCRPRFPPRSPSPQPSCPARWSSMCLLADYRFREKRATSCRLLSAAASKHAARRAN